MLDFDLAHLYQVETKRINEAVKRNPKKFPQRYSWILNDNEKLLDILRNINIKIIIVSKNIDETLKDKYESQYSNVTFINNNTIHDRFIIVDQNILYSCGRHLKIWVKNVLQLMNLMTKKN